MKVVILAGGLGTRISEESHLKPKPMIEIGQRPILWHIMKIYSHYGYNEFIICCGYKQHVIKEYFSNYFLHSSTVTFDFTNHNEMVVHSDESEPWKVTVVDTGLNTMTGGRIKRIEKFTENKPFMITYGDGVSDIDINELKNFHAEQSKMLTISAAKVTQRFGVLDIEDNIIKSFREKSDEDSSKINAGFMVAQPEIFKYISGDDSVFEKETMEQLSALGELAAYTHNGFWQCMDTQRDKQYLEELWVAGEAKWKVWKN